MLVALARPWRNWPRDAPFLPLLGLSMAMAGTIWLFYLAIDRLPLGIAIALQFLGPVAVALFGSRRASDLLWAILAAVGVWILVRPEPGEAVLDLTGVCLALGAAVGWASYIVLGRSAGASFGKSAAALSVSIAGLLILPVGVFSAGSSLLSLELLPLALVVALFSAVIPFSMELYALPRLPARTFAVFTSLEPAFAALSGLFILNELLARSQVIGVVLVTTAAAGAAWRTAAMPDPKPA